VRSDAQCCSSSDPALPKRRGPAAVVSVVRTPVRALAVAPTLLMASVGLGGQQRPNLVVSDAQLGPCEAFGECVAVKARNVGLRSAGRTLVRLYASRDDQLSGDQTNGRQHGKGSARRRPRTLPAKSDTTVRQAQALTDMEREIDLSYQRQVQNLRTNSA